ncbi:unnamed protein product [Arctogadus glacialis]
MLMRVCCFRLMRQHSAMAPQTARLRVPPQTASHKVAGSARATTCQHASGPQSVSKHSVGRSVETLESIKSEPVEILLMERV